MTDTDYRERIALARDGAWGIDSIINPPSAPPLCDVQDAGLRANMAQKLLTQLEVIDADGPSATAAHASASAATLALLARNTPANAKRACAASEDAADTLHARANELAAAHGGQEWTDDAIRATQLRRLTDFLIEEFAESHSALRQHINEYVGIEIDDCGELSGGAEAWLDAAWSAAVAQLGSKE